MLCPHHCAPSLAVLASINVAFHVVRLALGVSLEQAMDANWVIRPAVRLCCFCLSAASVALPPPHPAPLWVGVCCQVEENGGTAASGVCHESDLPSNGNLCCCSAASSAGCQPARSAPPGLQEGEQAFWELWGLFNISDWQLRLGPHPHMHLPAVCGLACTPPLHPRVGLGRPDANRPCPPTNPLQHTFLCCRSGIYFPAMAQQVVKALGLALVRLVGKGLAHLPGMQCGAPCLQMRAWPDSGAHAL